MIFGIGHDIVEIQRMERLLNKSIGERFRRRILTAAELELPGQSARPAEFLAGRFAAKEAVSKAFGCGIGQVLSFTDMEILPDAGGKPSVALTPEAWERLGLSAAGRRPEGGGYAIHLSITHERQLASAFAVVERVE
ncbi:holo-ACP synthase [Paenibacillus phocaensis]|uniref:holo-ACP synthase n=1 Tax=Paenibacillus phocaensis TaxID=1776378 RepID=UPI000399DB72|nr:holo-ACP synthase [Paenibacillus phocaensis]